MNIHVAALQGLKLWQIIENTQILSKVGNKIPRSIPN